LESACNLPRRYVQLIHRGYYPVRSADVTVVPREPNWFGGFTSMSHSGPWAYLQRVPLVFYGPGFIRHAGKVTVDREVTLADVAPTIAELIGTDPPPGIPGRPLDEVLLPEAERAGRPALIVTIAWDGGGWNVLDAWPDAWPRLRRMAREGASVQDVDVGSSPSVTPSVHTNIGTGTFPREHGIIGIEQRIGDNPQTGAFANRTPSNLLVPTLADTYDQATGNEALIGMFAYKSWHLGMIGHGAYLEGGDRDIGVILNQTESFIGNPRYYEVPDYLASVPGLPSAIRKVDLDDGELDTAWMGHEILADPTERRDTPAWVLYQTDIIKALLEREGFGVDDVPDLFYTNYKQIDEVGHNWNMVNEEMREVVRYTDGQLGVLERFLDDLLGKKRWVIIVTADHGQGPLPEASGAWPINMGETTKDIAAHLDVSIDHLFDNTGPVGFWLNQQTLEENDITTGDVADFLIEYRLGDNVPDGETVPEQWRGREDELIIEAAFPSDEIGRVWRCVDPD
jgi:Type I phosphodiesterase / nucleotide pyrophosphatase